MGAVGAFATSLNKPELHKPSGELIGAHAFERVFRDLPYINELVKSEVGEYVTRLQAALAQPAVNPGHQAAMVELAAQLQRASDDAVKAQEEAVLLRTAAATNAAEATQLARELEDLRRDAGAAAAAAEAAASSAQTAENKPTDATMSAASSAADSAADTTRDVANKAAALEKAAEDLSTASQDAAMDASQHTAHSTQAVDEISIVRNDAVVLNWQNHMAPVVVGGVGAYGDFTGTVATIKDAPDGHTAQGFTQNNAIAQIITFAERRTEANPTVLWYKELAIMWNAFDEKLVQTKPSPVAKTDWAKYNPKRPNQKGGEFERLASVAVYIDYVATFADVNSVDANDLVPPDRIVGGEDVDEFLGGLEKLTTTETDIVMG